MPSSEALATVAVVCGLVFAVLAVGSVRLAQAQERIAVRRGGRTVRVGGPGLVLILPVLETAERINLGPVRIDPLVVVADTSDGIAVRALGSALYRIVDPGRAGPDTLGHTTEMVESAIGEVIGGYSLERLVTERPTVGLTACFRARAHTLPRGVDVLDVMTTGMELDLDADLLRWADRRACGR